MVLVVLVAVSSVAALLSTVLVTVERIVYRTERGYRKERLFAMSILEN